MSDQSHQMHSQIYGFTSANDAKLNDVTLYCVDCDEEFVWSAGEQSFFRDKQLNNPPKRCKDCKKAKNQRLAAVSAAQAAGIRPRVEVSVRCAQCNQSTTVPFYPSQQRPVYCRKCYLEMKPDDVRRFAVHDERLDKN